MILRKRVSQRCGLRVDGAIVAVVWTTYCGLDQRLIAYAIKTASAQQSDAVRLQHIIEVDAVVAQKGTSYFLANRSRVNAKRSAPRSIEADDSVETPNLCVGTPFADARACASLTAANRANFSSRMTCGRTASKTAVAWSRLVGVIRNSRSKTSNSCHPDFETICWRALDARR